MNEDVTVAHDLAAAYITLNGTASPDNSNDFKSFYTNQQVIFSQYLIDNIQNMNTAIFNKI